MQRWHFKLRFIIKWGPELCFYCSKPVLSAVCYFLLHLSLHNSTHKLPENSTIIQGIMEPLLISPRIHLCTVVDMFWCLWCFLAEWCSVWACCLDLWGCNHLNTQLATYCSSPHWGTHITSMSMMFFYSSFCSAFLCPSCSQHIFHLFLLLAWKISQFSSLLPCILKWWFVWGTLIVYYVQWMDMPCFWEAERSDSISNVLLWTGSAAKPVLAT